jgi:hypothetical protein
MSTHDYSIANQNGANTRSDLNNALAAIVSNNSSATEPSTTYAFMWWADTANDLLKQRNAADSAWVDILTLSTGAVSNAAVADNSITLAKMAGGTDGELITYDTSGDPTTVPTGSSGEVLTSNGAGTTPTFQASSAHTPEGTAVVSTGETGATKFLREDGDGTCSWQAAGGGKVLQVLSQSLSANTSTTSATWSDLGLSVNITPSSTSSNILINFTGDVYEYGTSRLGGGFKILRDSTVIQDGSVEQIHFNSMSGGTEVNTTFSTQAIDSPSSTASINYKIQYAARAGTTVQVKGSATTYPTLLTVMEIGA